MAWIRLACSSCSVTQDVELIDDAVDAALRALEVLVADPACLPEVASHPGLTEVLLQLLHADASSAVIESLLLILLDLRQVCTRFLI